jgi:hypothetical protein
MPQNTNLNINPYYDDFDASKNYNRVLFKPGVPIQARELTTLQSALQDQIEKFGQHFFREGSVVIPGSLTYDNQFYAVKIEPTFFGVSVEAYYDQLVGLTIQGKTSGITAVVKKVLSRNQSVEGTTTLYVKYQNSSNQDYSTNQFLDGENLVTLSNFTYGSTTIAAGSDFATCVLTNATATGCSFSVSEGVFFARGAFISVDNETIILDQYSNSPSYRVGFFVNEEIINAVDDASLYDNAQGFSNFTAPGADRLKISLSLIKKDLSDFQDENFIELFRVDNGETKKIVQRTVYSEIAKELARRTYDESGDYYVRQFNLQAKESLNDRYSTFGVFFPEQNTDQGNTPSKDLLEIQVGPGKAYVKGFEVETFGTTFLDVEKPRETTTVEGAGIPFQAGNLLRVNNVYGGASVGLATTGFIDLRSNRLGSNKAAAAGQSIGRARVYDYKSTNTAYSNSSSQFDLYLFDIQTDTEITLNQSLSISAPALIEGKNSGARGYLRSVSGNILTLHQTSGNFIADEAILFNGIENGRVITKVLEFDITDIKSVRSEVGVTTFSADAVLEPKINFGGQPFSFTASSGGVSTVTSSTSGWTVGVKTGDIISYARADVSGPVYNRVKTITPTAQSMTIESVTNVTNVATGTLPSSAINVSGLVVAAPRIRNSNSGFLYAELPNRNIESVDLTNSDVFIRKEYRDRSSSSLGALDLPSLAGTDFVYAPFDEERYSVFYKDGTVEPLTTDQFQLTNGAKGATIFGLLKTSETEVIVVTTQQKSKVTSKSKILNRAASVTVTGSKYNYSGISTGVSDGLTFTSAYGKRVQDKEISLDVADVVNVHAVFQSSRNAAPTVPSIILSSLNGPNADNSDLIVGEILIGRTTGASAMVLGKTGTAEIFYVTKNNQTFVESEEVVFQESGVSGNIAQIKLGDPNIIDNFSFDTGQRLEYYDFGRLIRKSGSQEPSAQLKIFFDHYTINSSDNGEIVTTNSYPDYDQNVSSFNNVRNTDVIDFRPRVANYSGTLSPFEFSSRDFGASGQTVPNVIVSDENIVLDYNYYTGRIDRLFLNQDGTFTFSKGVSSLNPVLPEAIDSSFELATISYAPYVYNVDTDVTIQFRANKRYTMLDIGKLEDRIENLEEVTTLSLLEAKTSSLVIQDPDTGLDKFKSGFVVDNFSTFDVADKTVSDLKYDISNGELVARSYYDSVDLLVGSEALIGTNGSPNLSIDLRYAADLGSANIKKSKNIVTLNYSEVTDFNQPFASRTVNVNPFDVVTWKGSMELNPSRDVWIEREFKTADGGVGTTEVITTTSSIPNLRAQNIEFKAARLKPSTNFFSFFSRTDMSDNRSLTVPKLLEVTPVQGSFQVGETVVGRLLTNQNTTANPEIRFRLAQANHKDGPYNAPTAVYNNNPYSNVGLSSFYSDTTEVLNIDTSSLNQKSDERFFGYVVQGMKLVGETSNAEAIVKEVRLISDQHGVLVGSINIPPTDPKFANGTNTVELSAEKTPNTTPGITVSGADASFFSQGTLETQTTIVRTPPNPPAPARGGGKDPLAQSFTIEENPGACLTSVDIFFATKSSTIPVQLMIVELVNGYPSTNIVDGSVVIKDPDTVNVSSDASTATTFTFDAPVYLPTGDYAFVILADTDAYNVWISRVGEEDISTRNLPEIQKIIINKQPSLGSLFKSQNASTWEASQLEDIKYVARKAKFTTQPGTFRLYNPELRTFNARNNLDTNPIEVFAKKVTIGLSSAITSPNVVVGSEIRQDNTTSSGFVESLRGAIGLANTGLNLTNTGIGYSNGTFQNVNFTTLTGSGTGAIGIVTVSGGSVANVSVTNSGRGYAVGDTLTATLGSNSLGQNLTFTVGVVTSINTLVLTNVTGQNFNTSDQIQYVPTAGAGVGVGSTLFSVVPTTVTTNTDQYDGTYFKVSHRNHGMHADNNIVTITGVSGDTVPTTIQVGYAVSSIENISIASSTNFNIFEGAQVSAANPGFALIGDEIIAYTGVGNNILTGITTRGIDGTIPRSYDANTPIQKYEFSGVSLRKVNTTHNLINASNNIQDKVTLDQYHVKIAGSAVFNSSKVGGGSNAKATQNIQFESIVPQIDYTVPNGTNINAQVRTVSGTSIDGTEISFQDKGYQPVSLTNETRFNDPRIITSRPNEEAKLLALPGAKSFTFELELSTSNENVSPRINVFESFITTKSNRVNSPITNYVTDRRSNLLVEDPHNLAYLTKVIGLEAPAASLKVLLDAYRQASADIRVLYRLFRVDGSEIDKVFELFPGYDNLDANQRVINSKNNSGRPDRNISASLENQFIEYTWTANNLPQFSAYQIKVVCTTTNQAQSPRIRNFRAIALA